MARLMPRLTLRLIHRAADRRLGRGHVGDEAALQPMADARADARRADGAVQPRDTDERGDLARAHVQGRDRPRDAAFGTRAHIAVPLGFGAATTGCGTRTTIRPGSRKSNRVAPWPTKRCAAFSRAKSASAVSAFA